jgi:hypothetical protein
MEIFELLFGLCDIASLVFELISGLIELASSGDIRRPRR